MRDKALVWCARSKTEPYGLGFSWTWTGQWEDSGGCAA